MRRELVQIPTHQDAIDRVRALAVRYALSLLFQAKTLAFSQKAGIVLSMHIDRAQDVVAQTLREKSWRKEISLVFGGSLLGAFIQGFFSELSLDPPRATWILAYVAAGFVGLILIFIGLRE